MQTTPEESTKKPSVICWVDAGDLKRTPSGDYGKPTKRGLGFRVYVYFSVRTLHRCDESRFMDFGVNALL